MLQKIWSLLAKSSLYSSFSKRGSLGCLVGIIMLAMASCGTDSHHFSLEGHFLHMNQGDFYVYSPDGSIDGIDTIHVQGGRFAYEIPCEDEGIIVLVLPNFSEVPIFVEPGKDIDVDADASHIKDIDVSGSKANEKLSEWRKNTSSLSPDEQTKHAEQFIRENPSSIVSRWLIRKYFITAPKPNLKKAKELVALMRKANENNSYINRLAAGLENTLVQQGDPIPSFSAKNLRGQNVNSALYKTGKTVVLCWATWNFESTNMARRVISKINELKSQGKSQPKILSMCIDASVSDAKRTIGADSLVWTTVCDGDMWDTPIVKAFGFSQLPDNMLIENGRVKAVHLNVEELLKEIEQ